MNFADRSLVAVSVYVPLGLRSLLGVFALGMVLVAWHRRRLSGGPSLRSPGAVNLFAIALLAVLALIPTFRLAVAPGADQAMYSAIARGMTDSSPGLSPAWGDLSATFYPRGYSAVLAVLGIAFGPAKASLIGAGLALFVFAVSVGSFFRALGLGPSSCAMGIIVALVCHAPQYFFSAGSNSTTLALGIGLMGSRHFLAAGRQDGDSTPDLILASLFSIAALATHPIGGLASLGLSCAAVLAFLPARRASALLLPLLIVGAFAALLVKGGPELSLGERLWIQEWLRGTESVFRNAPLTPWGMLDAAREKLGGPFLVLAGAGILASLTLPRYRQLGLLALTGSAAFLLIEAIGPYLPIFGSVAFAIRMLPVLAIILAVPGLALLRSIPRTAHHVALASLLALGVGTNLQFFLHAVPMATPADLEAIACLDRSVPRDAIIDGAYGDATQWIPALTGRAVTEPHVHISVQDEYDALLRTRPPKTDLHFEGERLLYGGPRPFAPGGTEICRSGGARFFRQ